MKNVLKFGLLVFGVVGFVACGGQDLGSDEYGTSYSAAKGGKKGGGGGSTEEPPAEEPPAEEPACYGSLIQVTSCDDPVPQSVVNSNGDVCVPTGECYYRRGPNPRGPYIPVYPAECCPQ